MLYISKNYKFLFTHSESGIIVRHNDNITFAFMLFCMNWHNADNVCQIQFISMSEKFRISFFCLLILCTSDMLLFLNSLSFEGYKYQEMKSFLTPKVSFNIKLDGWMLYMQSDASEWRNKKLSSLKHSAKN